MVDPPSTPSTGLRALIIYDIYQWKTMEKSYENYSNLCDSLRIENISFGDFEYWFNRYSKEYYYSVKNGRSLPLLDISACVFSDFIKGKSAENSFNQISEALGESIVKKEDFERWRNSFSNGNRRLSDEKRPLEFCDLSLDAVGQIVESLDFRTQSIFRKVSRGLRDLVDQRKPSISYMSVSFERNQLVISSHENQVIYTNSTWRARWAGRKNVRIVRSAGDDDYWKRAFDDVALVFRNPKLHFDRLCINFDPIFDESDVFRIPKHTLKSLLDSLKSKISVRTLQIEMRNDDDLMTILPYLKPRKIDNLILNDASISYSPPFSFERIVQLDQWKNAISVICRPIIPNNFIHFFYHFTHFIISIQSISIQELLDLRDSLSKSPIFESCTITAQNRPDYENVIEILQLKSVFKRNFHFYPIANSKNILEFEWSGDSCFKITRK
ncbi:hypothetical protein GCK72_021196 [Caenorhabditis remanei]|uniref:F-box domain-containing protein n=1 Tax=Caenorhabditis remanei TaxID=31234 RepID=A0A6A5GIW9_CAERE|nr:hypothetical protein GCK72_021196 [Caenorhabditis remanei]KAF1754633.1 hypothetical protein GCK72_021196 [Caenorhabditis remanei]